MQRSFISLEKSTNFPNEIKTLRILQWNILADGLCGLRSDNGGFSLCNPEKLQWEIRKPLILTEILQYDPDIITLQEVDHYYDDLLIFFLQYGYSSIFATKPNSPCLLENNDYITILNEKENIYPLRDGCCIFIKKSKLQCLSSEVITYTSEDNINAQIWNQIGIISLYEIINEKNNSQDHPKLLIATTHLKVSSYDVICVLITYSNNIPNIIGK